MQNTSDEFLGIDKSSGFALRVLILSMPAGFIFLILGITQILSPVLSFLSYFCILFFNTAFLMPMSTEIQKIKKYIKHLTSPDEEDDVLLDMLTEKETRDLTDAINAMHKFWVEKNDILEKRTLNDAAVLDTLPDPLFIVNQSHLIIGSNLAARNIFDGMELNHKDIAKLIENERFIQALNKIFSHQSRQEELTMSLLVRKEKSKFYVRLNTLPWFLKGESVLVVTFYNLNKVLQLEQIQQDFVANASHELRTPLSIISGFIETLLTSAHDDVKAHDKFLKVMQEQTNYMSALIENLLALSKVELSVATLPETKININPLIKEIKNALELRVKERGLEIKTSLIRLPRITADEHQVIQILQNLLDNAVKYATENSVINVSTKKVDSIPPHRYYDVATGEAVEICISNESVNISKEDIERLKERFYRLQAHKNQNIKGTGLGLSIVTGIIKRHKGNIVISSENGITSICVYFPIDL